MWLFKFVENSQYILRQILFSYKSSFTENNKTFNGMRSKTLFVQFFSTFTSKLDKNFQAVNLIRSHEHIILPKKGKLNTYFSK